MAKYDGRYDGMDEYPNGDMRYEPHGDYGCDTGNDYQIQP